MLAFSHFNSKGIESSMTPKQEAYAILRKMAAPVMDKNHDTFLHFRVTKELLVAAHAAARTKGMSTSNWVRSLIVDAINKLEKRNG